MRTQVLIVGGGPVGLTLAIDLGRRGVDCVLVEQKPRPAFLPKMERCNARTMEMYRRMGLAGAVREAGLPGDVPMDVYVVLGMDQPPLLRLPYPSADAARADIRATNDGTAPLESYQLTSQYTLEPLLKSVAERLPSVRVMFGHAFVSLEQTAHTVHASVETASGERVAIEADYLVGCDGGGSPVRKSLGIRLQGEGNVSQLRQSLIYCDELYGRIPIGNGPGRGRHYHVADDRATFLIMQDDTKHWTLHSRVDDAAEMAAMFERTVGIPVRYEMLYCEPWRQNLLLAESYGRGRVLLAGDACHLVIPTGGLGMNTGIGDAIDLGWKLAGTLAGWGGPNLLESYGVERRQVGERNVGASRYASLGRRKWRSMYRPDIKDRTKAGALTRQTLTLVAQEEQRKTNEMIGAELGYRYVDSPIIANIPGGPEHLFREYHPTTWPGARLPHVWLDDGAPIQDRLPDSYVLLRLGGRAADTDALEAAMRRTGAPFTAIDVPDHVARDIYGADLLLLRPDMHVTWRGDTLPDDPVALAALATGH